MNMPKYENTESGGCVTITNRRTEGEDLILTCCGEPLYAPAIAENLMGCKVKCEKHLREYYQQQYGKTLEQAIQSTIEKTKQINSGALICDVCGKNGARPCPGEGQNLCGYCNDRHGINKWS